MSGIAPVVSKLVAAIFILRLAIAVAHMESYVAVLEDPSGPCRQISLLIDKARCSRYIKHSDVNTRPGRGTLPFGISTISANWSAEQTRTLCVTSESHLRASFVNKGVYTSMLQTLGSDKIHSSSTSSVPTGHSVAIQDHALEGRLVASGGNGGNRFNRLFSSNGWLNLAGGPGLYGENVIKKIRIKRKINPATWGATGSRKTATCTSNGTSTLSNCSGGDFGAFFASEGRVYVRIPCAGVSPTIATPSRPTLRAGANRSGRISRYSLVASIEVGSSVLTLTRPMTVEVGQTITVGGAGTSGSDFTTTVVARAYATTKVLLAATASTTVRGATVTLTTTTYSYAVAAIQGIPNGPITPAGPSATITQTAQSSRQGSNSTYLSVFTTLSGYGVAKGSLYVIYKRVNGGSLNFYTITNSTTFEDYGDAASSSFTCTNFGVPCTAPSNATPNDVFAKISAVRGSTWTLSKLPYPPVYATAAGLSPTTYPSMPKVTGNVTITHDDTPALTAIYAYLLTLPAPGYVDIRFAKGDYNIYPEDPYAAHGNSEVFQLSGLADVIFEGDGWGTKFHDPGDRGGGYGNFLFGICGGPNWPSVKGNYRCPGYPFQYVGSTTPYYIRDPANAGQSQVTLLTPSQSSNFRVDEYVGVETQTGSTYPGGLNGELNKTATIDSKTAVITLQWPLNKQYSAHPTGIYAECPTCAGAPTITPMPYGVIADNIIIRNFWLEGVMAFNNTNTIDAMQIENVNAHVSFWSKAGIYHNVLVHHNVVHEEGNPIGGADGLLTGAAGSDELRVIDNTYTGTGVYQQPCQENSANVLWSGNHMTFSGTYSAGNPEAVFQSACYGFSVLNNDIQIGGANNYSVFGWNPSQHVMAEEIDNRIHLDILGLASGDFGTGYIRQGVQTNSIARKPGTSTPDYSDIDVSDNQWLIDHNGRGGGPLVFGNVYGHVVPF
jgi:hypothetical protein